MQSRRPSRQHYEPPCDRGISAKITDQSGMYLLAEFSGMAFFVVLIVSVRVQNIAVHRQLLPVKQKFWRWHLAAMVVSGVESGMLEAGASGPVSTAKAVSRSVRARSMV